MLLVPLLIPERVASPGSGWSRRKWHQSPTAAPQNVQLLFQERGRAKVKPAAEADCHEPRRGLARH